MIIIRAMNRIPEPTGAGSAEAWGWLVNEPQTLHSALTILPRHVSSALRRQLEVMPAVAITGARQTGKSTLARTLPNGSRRFLSLDDLDVLEQARRDPTALVAGQQPVTLDEIQREPNLLLAIKNEIDRHRIPGQFLLMGSADLLMTGHVSESLAGRAGYLSLWPMTRREQLGLGTCGLWEDLLTADHRSWIDMIRATDVPSEEWRALAWRGGFPTPAVHLTTAEQRAIWFEGYVRTYLERDLQELASIAALPDFRRLMRAACLRIGNVVNQSELGRDVALPQPTVHRYLNLLETSHMLVRLPAYAVHRTKRLIKSPKLYWGDVGLALHLAGLADPAGAHLENLVLHDLLAWRDARARRPELLYWRTTTGQEVDFVIEIDGRLQPIEVKALQHPRMRDAAALRAFRKEYSDVAREGLLIHAGDAIEWITPDVLAVPWWRVI